MAPTPPDQPPPQDQPSPQDQPAPQDQPSPQDQPAPQARDRQWLLAFLPAFPLLMLVLRLWYLSRQDLPTMLLLVQYVNPLGLVSALLITLIWVLSLTMRVRHAGRPLTVRTYCVVLPLVVAVVAYAWLGPAIVASVRAGELATAFLLVVPPAIMPLVTGPVPARLARLVTHWPATVAAVLSPFLVGAIFLRVPVLPTVAIELTDTPDILLGSVVTVDDQMTTLLDLGGSIRFIPNAQARSRTLCPDPEVAPASIVDVHGWPVEQTALEWIAPSRRPTDPDPRCVGRPADGPPTR
jgi:hypothetical protein